MKKFAVGVINFFDNNLKLEIVDAETKYEALKQHSEIEVDWLEEIGSNSIESIKGELFDMDIVMDIKEIKE